MKIMKPVMFLGVIVGEMLVLYYAGSTVYRKWTSSHVIRVMPISKETVRVPVDTALRYYYEPISNTDQTNDFSYMRLSGTITHTINEDGLNERREMSYRIPKPAGVFRIVTVGDSFTEGAFVETKDNYSEVLEDMLNATAQCNAIQKYEVINLGVAGYDMQYDLERFKRKGIKYDPDLVILWTDENDYVANNEKYYALSHTWNPEIEAPDIIKNYESQGDFAPKSNAIWYKFNSLYKRTDLISEELSYLRTLISLVPYKLIIFSLERIPADIREAIRLSLQTKPEGYFFPSISNSYDRFPDDHPSVEGHKQFAQFLFWKIIQAHMLPCQSK